MRILNLDIETRPAEAYIWDLKTRYVPPANIIRPKEMLCFAAKWVGEPRVFFYSQWHDGQAKMVQRAHHLLNEADAVLHYNGKRFDEPEINREIVQQELWPPSPYRHIDLYQVAKTRFAFMSNSLDYVTKQLGTSRKLEHAGLSLWINTIHGDLAARQLMRRYNIADVLANEDLYYRWRPWITGHPAMTFDGGCPTCGEARLQRRGWAFTQTSSYRRYQCQACGKWTRETKRVEGADVREVAP